MESLYRRFIHAWEAKLCFRATNRTVRPFDWGVDWVNGWPQALRYPQNGHSPYAYFQMLNEKAIHESGEFFGYTVPRDFHLEDQTLRFTSPVVTPHHENNTVAAQWFPAEPRFARGRRAAIVLPHWNAQPSQHVGLCKGLAKLGISALRLSLPYHDIRMPKELQRADYAVSSNIGRTIDATRQAVIDARCLVDWLATQGYERLGIVGTSLGSCYAFLTSAHEPRLKVNVYNHCSTYFADVVWTGLSTRHIREGIEGSIDLEQLRESWMAISPVSYMDRYAAHAKKSLFIYTRYDTTFLPELSEDVIRRVRSSGIDNRVLVLPCGHYTLGMSPFKFIDGYHICSFLLRHL
jgi:hypothetical protein